MAIYYNGQEIGNMLINEMVSNNTLIVTGNLPTSWISQSQGATADISTCNLSHSVEDMIAAFQDGRDVRIKLTPPTEYSGMYYEFGNWKLKFAELIVTDAQILMAGYYQFYAYGMGYAEGSNASVEATPMQIMCSLSSTPRLITPVKA